MSEELHTGIDRDSSRKRLLKYTRKAFKLLPRLNKPQILDVGCGSGVPTIELAILSRGTVIGIDINQSLLNKLDRKTEKEGLTNSVTSKLCSMHELDFPDESFDIVWIEGAIGFIGFEKGLKVWRRLLKPKGFLVVHEEIRTVANKLEQLPEFGYGLYDQFLLPEDAHWTEYYKPLESRVKGLFEKYKSSSEALTVLRKVQEEIDMVKEDPIKYRTAFYIMQKI
jgi:ubiquinone/menaquinone biosynthesis C-methylase UbiE